MTVLLLSPDIVRNIPDFLVKLQKKPKENPVKTLLPVAGDLEGKHER